MGIALRILSTKSELFVSRAGNLRRTCGVLEIKLEMSLDLQLRLPWTILTSLQLTASFSL